MKKIFFSASIYYPSQTISRYEEIIKCIKKNKSIVSIDWVSEWKKTVKNKTAVSKKIDHDKFFDNTHEILNSDSVIAEVSHPTVGVGYQLFFATLNNKKVLALYNEKDSNKDKIKSIINSDSPLISLRKYNKKSLPNLISNFINGSSHKLSKFNFVINDELKNYLDWLVINNPNTSKSVLLREAVITKIMYNDIDYQKHLKNK